MANNRMLLVHVPTGLAVGLGKRMGWGWYLHDATKVGARIEKLHAVLMEEHHYAGAQDDFALVFEDDSWTTVTIRSEQWNYGPVRGDGVEQLVIDPSCLRKREE